MSTLEAFQQALERIPSPSPALRAYVEAGRRYVDTQSDAAFNARVFAWEALTADEQAVVRKIGQTVAALG